MIDGDMLTVLTSGPDEGGAFAFYEAPQVQSPADGGKAWNCGVMRDKTGGRQPMGCGIRIRGR